jgi:outer membrane protein TolC
MLSPWRVGRVRRGLVQCAGAAPVAIAVLAAMLTTAHAQRVDDAMAWALRTSTSLQSDDYRQQATEARLRGSIEAFLPTVEWQQQTVLNSHIVYSPDLPSSGGPNSFASREPDQFGIQATLPLFDGFRRYNTYRAAALSVEAGRFLAVNARQQVMLDAATAYLAVERDEAIVTFRKAQVDNIARILTMTEKRFETRDSTQTDVALAQSRVLAARAALEAARADLASSQIEFVRITGVTAGHFVSGPAPDGIIPRTREEMRAVLVNDNPQLLAARLDVKAAKFTAEATKAELLPTVNLVASHGQANDTTPLTPKITDTTIKLQIRIPIYQPGAYSHINEASALAMQRRFDEADTEAKTAASADQLYQTRLSLIREAASANARVNAMRRAVAGYRVEQAAGYRTLVDVLNALNELADAQVFQAEVAYTRDKSTYMLGAALARLQPAMIVAGR